MLAALGPKMIELFGDLADGSYPYLVTREQTSVTAHLDAGADHVVIQVLGDDPAADPRPALRDLGSALQLCPSATGVGDADRPGLEYDVGLTGLSEPWDDRRREENAW